MVPEDLSQDSLISALENANLVYFDGRLPDTALVVAEEVLFVSVSYFIHDKYLVGDQCWLVSGWISVFLLLPFSHELCEFVLVFT